MYERTQLLEYMERKANASLAGTTPSCPLTRKLLPWHYILPFPEAREYIKSVAKQRGWREVWYPVDA